MAPFLDCMKRKTFFNFSLDQQPAMAIMVYCTTKMIFDCKVLNFQQDSCRFPEDLCKKLKGSRLQDGTLTYGEVIQLSEHTLRETTSAVEEG
jgi:hypothetical protein